MVLFSELSLAFREYFARERQAITLYLCFGSYIDGLLGYLAATDEYKASGYEIKWMLWSGEPIKYSGSSLKRLGANQGMQVVDDGAVIGVGIQASLSHHDVKIAYGSQQDTETTLRHWRVPC